MKADGTIALAGNSFDSVNPGLADDGFILVTDGSGATIAGWAHDGPGQDYINDITESPDGGFLTVGDGSVSINTGPYLMVEKTDALGFVGATCDRIAPMTFDIDPRPISVTPASSMVRALTPSAARLVLTERPDPIPGSQTICQSP